MKWAAGRPIPNLAYQSMERIEITETQLMKASRREKTRGERREALDRTSVFPVEKQLPILGAVGTDFTGGRDLILLEKTLRRGGRSPPNIAL